MRTLSFMKKGGRGRGSARDTNSLPNGDTHDVPPMLSTQAPGTKLTNRQGSTRERPATSTRGLGTFTIADAVVCLDLWPKYRLRGLCAGASGHSRSTRL